MQKEKEETNKTMNKQFLEEVKGLPLKLRIKFALTCWIPLFRYQGAKYNLMILNMANAVVKMRETQLTLIKNNNVLIQQARGDAVVAADKEDKDVSYQ